MKILLLTHRFPYPVTDGGSAAVAAMAESLAETGLEVTVLAMSTEKHPATDTASLPSLNRLRIFTVPVPASVSVRGALWNLLFSDLPYHVCRYSSAVYRKSLNQLLNEGFDMVQLESVYLFSYMPVIRRFPGIKVVFRPHNIESEIWSRLLKNEKNTARQAALSVLIRRLKRYEKRIINQYDLLVPISERELDAMNREGNLRPALVIPYGLKLPSGNKLSKTGRELCFLGSLDWHANQEGLKWFLDKIWPQVHQQFPHTTLHIAGRNCPAWFAKEFLRPGIQYHGMVNDAMDFLSRYRILVVPLLSGSGIRVRIIEALAVGTIIIATSVAAEGLPLVHGKHILMADNANDFIRHLVTAITDPSSLNTLAEEGSILIRQNFNRTMLARKLVEFYQLSLS